MTNDGGVAQRAECAWSLLVELEPKQAELLESICAGPLIAAEELSDAGALEVPVKTRRAVVKAGAPSLF